MATTGFQNKTSDNDLLFFLQEEIDRTVKATRMTWIVGLMVAALIGCYMSAVVYLWRDMLDPVTAARMVGIKVEESLPGLMGDTERAGFPQP